MKFSFIQITDHHLGESETDLFHGFNPAHAFHATLRHIAQNEAVQPDFIISTGDLVENPTKASYSFLRQLLNISEATCEAPGPLNISIDGAQELPFYALPGNHDDRENFFTSLFSISPPMQLMNATFVHNEIQFICLDWGPDAKGVAHPETLEFLEASLDRNVPSILVMHHHIVQVGSRWMDDFLADDLESFRKIIRDKRILGIVCGHTHLTYENEIESIPVFGTRSTSYSFALQDEPLPTLLPPHYRVITVKDGLLTTEIFEVSL